jgi:ubiquinone/menaquinone biosynthesis C-methylase UbiE
MIEKKLRRSALAAAVVLAVLGVLSAGPLPGPKAGQVRPDLDENDLQRDKNFPMDAVLDSLGIKPGMTVAEIGAGWGYLSFKLARRVAPDGTVLAEDIEQRWIDLLRARAAERGLTNIESIRGKETDPLFPAGKLDLIFMHAVLQWIEDRPSFLRAACAGLKAGGRLVIIEPETEGDDAETGVVDSGHFPTRAGYLELFRRAGLELVSAERKPDWKWPVFVLMKKLPQIPGGLLQ